MTKESTVELESLYTTITQIYRTLETLERPIHMWDDILVFIAVQRLDSESVKTWEQHLGSSKDPSTWKQLNECLMTRLLTLQAVEKSRRTTSQSNQQSFKAYNCLGQHRTSACRSTRRCKKCGKKHHSIIHKEGDSDQSYTSTSTPGVQTNCAAIHLSSSTSQTLLATFKLFIISDKGEQMKVRAFIDPGSQISFLSERLAQRLHLPRLSTSLQLKGIKAVKAGRTRSLVSVQLKPYFKSSAECVITAHLLPKLAEDFSSTKSGKVNWAHLEGLQLADPDFQSSKQIHIIIGADYYGQIIEEGLRKGPTNTPTAKATIFGWILLGPEKTCSSPSEVQEYHVSIKEELSELLKIFWKLDEMPTTRENS